MKKIFLISALYITGFVVADDEIAAAKINKGSKVTTPPPSSTMNPVVLAPANPRSAWGYFGFAEVLYWHADVDETDWASKNTNIASDNFVPQKTYSLKFKWDYAFRVGVGATTAYDDWDTRAYYTRFHTDNSRSAGVKTNQQVEDLNTQIGGFKQGKIDWHIHYNVLDVDLGRWFHVSKGLALRPFIGAKAAWIDQDIHRKFLWDDVQTQFATSTIHDENDFWGVGVSGGINTNWTLGHLKSHYFTLFGDVAAAFMYGHFDLTHHERTWNASGNLQQSLTPNDLNHNLGVPTLQAILGFGWDTTFNADKGTVTVKLGYEFNYWFKQLHRITNEVFAQQPAAVGARNVKYDRFLGDLALQGLTLDCRFDF